MTLALEKPTEPRPSAEAPRTELTKRQKAAIVVRLLLAEGARISLDRLPEGLQEELTLQMSEMRFVDRATLAQVVGEFVDELEAIGLAFPEGLEGALSVLDGTISAAMASRLRKQANLQMPGDPWERIRKMPPEKLQKILETESIEVAAVLLSKLEVSVAAELLGRLPGERARRITYAVSLTGSVAPETVRKIGLSIAADLDVQPAVAFSDGPVERVGAILNFSRTTTRDEVLAGLDEEDAGFAAQVRRAIFTFAHIPARIVPRDVPKIVREVEPRVLATIASSARGDDETAMTFVLENMSKRLAEAVREEAQEIGRVKPYECEDAMAVVVARIRELEAAGELTLLTTED